MDDLSAVMLRKQLLSNLHNLKLLARDEHKNLTQRKSSKGISVLSAFEVPLEPEVAEVLSRDISFIKSYKYKVPCTLENFVRYAGGLTKSIDKLIDYRTRDDENEDKAILHHQSAAVIDYVDMIEEILVKARGMTPQKRCYENYSPALKEFALPFCALCYRRVSCSQFYCIEHHPSRNLNGHTKAKRKLISAVYRHCEDELAQEELQSYKQGNLLFDAKTRYRWLNLFSVDQNLIIRKLNELDHTCANWQDYAQVLVNFTKKNYPFSYSKISNCQIEGTEYWDWVLLVVNALGGKTEANIWMIKDVKSWKDGSTKIQVTMTLLTCISRYQSYKSIMGYEIRRGVRKGTNVDQDKRDKLKFWLKNREKDSSITISKIAKELNVSRVALYKMKKRIEGS